MRSRLPYRIMGCLMLFAAGVAAPGYGQEAQERVKALNDSAIYYREELQRYDLALLMNLKAQKLEAQLPVNSGQRLHLHRAMSIHLKRLGSIREAAHHGRIALDLFAARNVKANVETYHAIADLAGYFMILGQNDSSLAVFRESLQNAREYGDVRYIASAHNNIGMVHQRAGAVDSADHYYRKAMQMLTPGSNDKLRLSIRDNQAGLLVELGDTTSALALYALNYAFFPDARTGSFRKPRTGLKEAALLLDRQELRAAQPRLVALSTMLDTMPGKATWEYRKALETLWQEYYLQSGNPEKAMLHASLRLSVIDSMQQDSERSGKRTLEALNTYKRSTISQVIRLKSIRLTEEEVQLVILRQRAKNRMYWLIFLGLGTLLVVLSLILFFRRRNRHQLVRQEVMTLENRNRKLEREQLTKEVETRQKDLTDFVLNHTRQNEWSSELLARLNRIKLTPKEARSAAIRELIIDIGNQLAVEERLQIFQENVETVNQEFYEKLNQRFPALTKSEKQLCGLIRLQLSGKEIANLRNVEPRSVTKSKGRLRKKMGLEPSQDLYAFLKQL